MIPIRIEATNPSNVGSYKNTPNCAAAKLTAHDKPVAGSRKNWHKHTLISEAIIDISACTKSDLVEEIKSHVLQSDRWLGIAYSIDNDISAGELINNEFDLDDIIENKILPMCLAYSKRRGKSEIDVNRILSLPEVKSLLDILNSSYKSEYSEVLSHEDTE